jgi:type IV fimbrial biogenesis protein FimT
VYDYMRFDFGDGRHERAVLSFFDPDNKRQTRAELCFSPRGRTFLRAGDAFTELAGVPRFTVTNSGTGLERTVFLPPNGVARLAQ